MTLYETIFVRRQVRKYSDTLLDAQALENIQRYISSIEQISGQQAQFEIVSAEAVNGNGAPHYLLSYCGENSAAYANVGYVLQEADLYIQSIGLGSGWFMGVQPRDKSDNHCMTLAFGNTDVPLRKGAEDFKRISIDKISPIDNAVSQAVRLAPSAMNSQPWKLDFSDGKVIVKDVGRGIMRAMLRGKLNKIDTGIAVRHAVIALEHEGKTVTAIMPRTTGKDFEVEITYK
ncbi:MAG: hypothetical protein GX602_05810 [Dehalococcoidales bacterium]|nr:hypothetical protein [Dehalococcoidales bacterium]